ncbi:MAG: hypothetical protein FWE77_01135 [Clostridia bacterium]|nr:hypothetical protein [Clostridia bacterium]
MKRIAFLAICLGVVLLLFGVAGTAAATDGGERNPFSISASASPRSIAEPRQVDITITVTNLGESAGSIPVRLYDPNRTQLSFPAELGQGQSATYTGKWSVTEEELANGKINFRYTYRSPADGIDYSGVVSASISRTSGTSSSSARLTASYTISPESASRGQTVTLTYTLRNNSGTDMVDVVITNPNLTKERVNIARIPAGETVSRNYQYTMGTRSVTSKPRVSYKPEGGGNKDVRTISNIGSKTIRYERGGVTANLRSSSRADVEPGTKLDLTLTITNTSGTAFKDVKITSELLGDIATGIELSANNGKHTETKTITVEQSAEYVFQITGTGADGKALDITSNMIQVTALDMSKRLQLAIEASTDTLQIYEEPAEIDFVITVQNIGEATGTDLVLMHGKTTIADIGTLAPGEERVFAKRLLASMHGTFGFSVTGLNGQGVTQTVTQKDDEMIFVAYAEPTPMPTSPPLPTAAPTTEATDIPISGGTTDDSEGGGMTLLFVLAGVLLAALFAVLGMIVIGRRRQAQEEAKSDAAIDSIERASRRDYMGGTSKHKPVQASKPTRGGAKEGADADAEDADYRVDLAEEFERGKPPSKPAPAAGVSLTSGLSMSELAAQYGRPGQEEAPAARRRARSGEEAPARTTRTVEGAASAYLSRMREPVQSDEAGLGEYAERPEHPRRRRARSANA